MPPSRTRLLAVGVGHHPRQVAGHQIVHRLPAAAEGHMVQHGAAARLQEQAGGQHRVGAFSPIMMQGALVLPLVSVGVMEAATCKPSRP
jgi:hypothetical protein